MLEVLVNRYRRITLFEKLLLFLGIIITIIGFYLINKIFVENPKLSWALIQSAFLWLILIFMTVLTDSNESIKEELSSIIRQQVKETKFLKEIVEEEVREIRLLREKIQGRKK